MAFGLCRWLVKPWGGRDWPGVSRDSGKESLVGTGLGAQLWLLPHRTH